MLLNLSYIFFRFSYSINYVMNKKISKSLRVGACALCCFEKELQDSHLVPDFVYRRLQKTVNGHDHPITIKDGNAFQSSRQLKYHLLCFDCEQIFSKYETYFGRITAHNLQILKTNISVYADPNISHGVLSEDIDTNQIVKFGASIIWRFSVLSQGVKLGKYEEAFRKYLIGEADFPSNAAIHIALVDDSITNIRPTSIASVPKSTRTQGQWIHHFMFCGIAFRLNVGGQLNPILKIICLNASNPNKYIMQIKNLSEFTNAYETIMAAIPRGKLAHRTRNKINNLKGI